MLLMRFATPNGLIEVLQNVNLGIHVKLDGKLLPWAWDMKDWVNIRHLVNRVAGSEVFPQTWADGEDTLVSPWSRAQSVA